MVPNFGALLVIVVITFVPMHQGGCRCGYLAAHVFAYDLAFEPEGWPWRPVSHIKYCLLSIVCL